jgi:anthranilate synthase/aminodeoxychorismate synthase-like glutamine amidotransferase
MILVIDNYDSFTYNLVQYIGELGYEVVVKRNDEITCEEVNTLNPEKIVISPGPCTPLEAGISVEIIKTIEKPIFGVCLGHQAIGVAFGGEVIKANEPIHGKLSLINHSERGVFKDIENPYNVVRYHSLIVNPENLSDELEITATLVEDENMIMGLSHKTKPIVGVQFHPESIDTKFGKKLINNFLKS